jgi:hypothetical protein
MIDSVPKLVDIKEACRIIGGTKPIHPATYYRGVKAGIYPAPVHPAPGIARVILPELIAALRANIGDSADERAATTEPVGA